MKVIEINLYIFIFKNKNIIKNNFIKDKELFYETKCKKYIVNWKFIVSLRLFSGVIMKENILFSGTKCKKIHYFLEQSVRKYIVNWKFIVSLWLFSGVIMKENTNYKINIKDSIYY